MAARQSKDIDWHLSIVKKDLGTFLTSFQNQQSCKGRIKSLYESSGQSDRSLFLFL